jgi:hypothetical protein
MLYLQKYSIKFQISEDTVKKAMKTKTDKMVEKNVETGKNVLATKDLKENHFKIAEKKEEKESIYKKVNSNFPYKLAQSNK